MKISKLLKVASAAFIFAASPAAAQTAGTVTNHALPIGQGPDTDGFKSLLLPNAQIPVGQTSADPAARALSGDVTMDNLGAVTISANKVSNAKFRQSGALSLVGRASNSTGDVADIQATAGSSCAFRESGSSLACGTLSTAAYANNSVTDAKLRQSAALSLIGRSANSLGDVADISASAGSSCAFRENSNTIGCGTLATAALANNAVTNAKLAQMANSTVKCRTTAGTGDPEDCTATQGRSVLGLGTAAQQNTGTSGANVPLLNGNNAHSGSNVFAGAVEVQQSISYTGDITPTQITSNQNDYAPTGFSTASVLRLSTDASRDLTGLAGGSDGRAIYLYNPGSFNLVLKHESGSSSASNRFNFGGDLTLAPSQGASLLYDATASRWRQVGGPASSGGGSGTVTSVVCGNATITSSGTCITDPGYGYQNASIAISAGSSALTIALKDAAGNDPSAASPAGFFFRNATGTTGTVTARYATAASSLVISSGSQMGVTSSTGFRIWVVMFDDGGTLRLGAINCSGANSIYPLGRTPIASSTAEGGAGGADSAQVFYTGTAVASKPYVILGYIEWSASGLTSGTWTTTNHVYTQPYGPGVPLPGQVVQPGQVIKTDTFTSTTTGALTDITGLSVSISLTSAANKVRVVGAISAATDIGPSAAAFAVIRGSTNIGGGVPSSNRVSSIGGVVRTTDANSISAIPFALIDTPNSAASTTYKVQFILQGTGTVYINRTVNDSDVAGVGRFSSSILVDEIMG